MKNVSKVKKTLKSWELDESLLSDTDKEVLKEVGFPVALKSRIVLIRRTAKKNIKRIGWVDKENPELKDVRYLTTSYKVASQQVGMLTPHTKNAQGRERSREEIANDLEKIEEMQASKSYSQVYIDAESVEEELESLLLAFSDPKPTPGMIAATKDVDTDNGEQEGGEVTEDNKPKALSNIDKGTAKRMFKEESKDVEEITEALGVDKDRVMAYLKTLK